MAYNKDDDDYTFRLPKDLSTVPIFKLVSGLSWSSSQSHFNHVASFLSSSHDSLLSQLSTLTSTYNTLAQHHSALKSTYQQLDQDHSALKSTYDQLDQDHSALKPSYDQLEKDCSALKSTLEREKRVLKSKCGVLQKGKTLLVSELESVKVKCGVLESEVERLKSQLDQSVNSTNYKQAATNDDNQKHLFIGKLKKEWSLHQVEQLIRQAFSGVVSVDRALNPVPEVPSGLGRSPNRGFVFVHFSSHEEAAHAHHVGSNPDFTLDGDLHPSIEWALPQAEFDLAKMAKSKVAYVGNLPPAVNEEYLRQLFGHIGKVEKIIISKKSLGMVGYIHFATRMDLERAIEKMNGRIIGAPDRGPPFKIKVAVAKNPAKGKVHTSDGVIKAQIKLLDTSNKRRDYSQEARTTKARRVDNMAACIDSLSPVIKDRLLRVFNLRIATEHDIDLLCLNGLKELPEASAISVLDQFLFSGADKDDKRSFFNSLVAEKRQSRYTSSISPHQSDYLLRVPLTEDFHNYTRNHMSSFSPVPAEMIHRFSPIPVERQQIRRYPA